MKINVNSEVTFELTPNGLKIYEAYLQQFKRPYEIPADNILVMPLWEYAHIFGLNLYNGNPQAPFSVDNSITFTQLE